MRTSFRLVALTAALLPAAAAPAAARDVLAVLSSDSDHYRQAYEGFQEEWGSSVPYVLLGRGDDPAPDADAVVAFGSRAAIREWPGSVLLETCLAPGARPARKDALDVLLLPEAPALVARMRRLLPGLKVLRVLWSSDLEDAEVGELSDAAAAQGVKVISERVENPARLPEKVRSFAGSADALWLMPDPALVNAKNFAALREYAAAARVPFLAPTEGLAEKGATATLAAPFRDVGRAAAAALKARRRGETVRSPCHPSRIVVTVNESAAKAVGFDLKAASGVDRVIP